MLYCCGVPPKCRLASGANGLRLLSAGEEKQRLEVLHNFLKCSIFLIFWIFRHDVHLASHHGEIFMPSLSEQLVAGRKARGWTQAQLAERAGVSRRTLISIEAGHDCSMTSLLRLFHSLDMELIARPLVPERPTLETVYAENAARFRARGS